MDNLSALRGLCNAICNTFYPDRATMELMLFNEGLNPTDAAKQKDGTLLKIAIVLTGGYVESSRTENGVSTSVDMEKVDHNIKFWCNQYGLNAEDYVLSGLSETEKVIENGSNRW